MTRDPFGAEGDFTTAPEIWQMFGELHRPVGGGGLDVDGRGPIRCALIELGPGRGTLMSDALRAARVVARIPRRARRHAGRDEPAARTDPARRCCSTAGAPIAWARSFAEAPDGPAIILANEFLDALPVRQFVRRGGQWRERLVRLDGAGELAFGVADKPEPYLSAEADDGSVIEVSAVAHRFMFELAARLAKQGGAALFLDYGHPVTGFGDTLQALRAHRLVDPLAEPGECDLTAHVDFAAMARSARAAGAAVHGPIDQGDFLRALGIDVRARALGERTPDRRRRNRGGAPPPGRQGRRRDGRAVQGDGGRQSRRAGAARLPARPGEAGVTRGRDPARRDARAARRRARVLHPPRRRLRGRLRFAQRRRRLERRA